METYLQPSFASGEIPPSAYARVDLARYAIGLKTCRNFIVRVFGGADNRPGTRFICKVKDRTKLGRLIPFDFNTEQTYVLEFGDLLFRVIKDGGLVVEAAKTITGVTNATPVVVTSAAHGFSNGEWVYISGTGLTSIDNRFWIVAAAATNTFELSGSTAPGATSSTGSAARVYEKTSPYTAAQLMGINRTQLADVMTLVHGSVRPKQISRLAHDNWTVNDFAFSQGPFQDVATDKTFSMTASATTGNITITASNPKFTASHAGMLIYLGQRDYGKPWEVGKAVVTGDIRRAEGKYYKAQNNGTTGTLRPSHDNDIESDGAVDWLYLHGGFGTALITAFTDSTHVNATVQDYIPDDVVSSGTYKYAFGAWGGDQGSPRAVTFHQQRQIFASTPARPQDVWGSVTDAYTRFGKSSPTVDDDAFRFRSASNEVNAIKHLAALGKLLLLTSGAEWAVSGGDNDVLAPGATFPKIQGYNGAGDLAPLYVRDTILYLEAKNNHIRDLRFDFSSDGYAGVEVSLLASHLLEKHAIVDWAYQKTPFSTIWMVREDGVLLGLTYLREQQVLAWHRHDTDGFYERVAAIPEGAEDGVYFIVRRTVNGQEERYVERLASRLFSDVRDAFFVDCGLTYDGRNKSATTMTVTELSGGWEYGGATFTLTASASVFTAAFNGHQIHITAADERVLRLQIVTTIGGSPVASVTVTANRDIPEDLRGAASTAWGHAVFTVTGAEHLNGKEVAILSDGNVEPKKVVSGGSITLLDAGVVIHLGLPFVSDLETLALNVAPGGSALTRQKNVHQVKVIVNESRGIFAGRGFDAGQLMEFKQRDDETYDEAVRPLTGTAAISIPTTWEDGGRVCIRQSDPLPLSVLGIVPDFTFGGAT